MPTEILDVTKRFMREPIRILVKKEELTLEGIKQYYVNVEKEDWKVNSIFEPSLTLKSARNFVRSLRDRHHHPVCHLLEHKKEGRMAHPAAQQTRFHRLLHARRHGPEEPRTGDFNL